MSAASINPGPEEQVLSESLQRLKRHGCSLLVVGAVPGRTRVAAVRRLLGDETLRRSRIVAVTDAPPDRIAGLLGPGDARILDHASDSSVRGATTATPVSTRRTEVRGVESGLDALERAIHEATDRVERGKSLAPGELRLSVDSLRPLLGSHRVESVGEFVDAVGDRVRAVDGMGHHVLPVPYDSDVVDSLTEHVDATVELRARQRGPEQRWHLPDVELTTSWVDL